MAVKWFTTKFPGVRYREHVSRKHGIRPDWCFSIRYKLNGKDKEEVVGWSSQKITAEEAHGILSTIKRNIRCGEGPCSLAEIREASQKRKEQERLEEQERKRKAVTLDEFWNTTYLPILEATKTPWTIKTEKHLYKNWVQPALGNFTLQGITSQMLESLTLKAKKKGKSAATIRYILALFSQIWNKAELHDIVQGLSPTRRVQKPRKDNRRMRFLSHDEARRLLDELATRSKDTHDATLLSLFCGLRAGEIHGLTWGDIDMENDIILIKDPKSKHSRYAFMTEEVKSMLTGRQGKGDSKTSLIFPATNGCKRLWVSDAFPRAVDAIGLNNTGEFTLDAKGEPVPVKITDARQRVVFHSLRHTFASWHVQKGTPIFTVAELMGHTTLTMTRRYSHLSPEQLRKASLVLEGGLNIKTE